VVEAIANASYSQLYLFFGRQPDIGIHGRLFGQDKNGVDKVVILLNDKDRTIALQ
jgi:hypothetical protein